MGRGLWLRRAVLRDNHLLMMSGWCSIWWGLSWQQRRVTAKVVCTQCGYHPPSNLFLSAYLQVLDSVVTVGTVLTFDLVKVLLMTQAVLLGIILSVML